MSDRERCTSCGANVPAETGVCAYCGTTAAHDANVPPPARDRASEKVERFDRLAEHATFDKWMRWRPADDDAPFSSPVGGGTSKGVLLIVVGIAIALVLSVNRGSGGLVIVPIVFIGLGIRNFVRANGPATRPSNAAPSAPNLKPYPALVVTKRAEVTTGEYGGTSYFVTLEFRSGTRREYDVDGEFYGLVADDDIGVAYIREGELLHFKKIDA